MKTYLVLTDFSKNSKDALQYAINMARISGAKIKLFSVLSMPPSTSGATGSLAIRIKEKAQEDMDVLMAGLVTESVTIEPTIREGSISSAVLHMIEETEADLVVLGTKGLSDSDSQVMGSTASDIIAKSPVAVLTIPRGTVFHGLKRIVYATDLQKGGPVRATELVELTQSFGSQVDVLHVFPPDGDDPIVQLDLLRKEMQNIANEGRVIKYHLVKNEDIREGLVQFLDQSDIELLAMVTKKRNLIQKLFDPSLTRRVVRDTEIPLLSFQALQ